MSEDMWTSLCLHSKLSLPRSWEEERWREFRGVVPAESHVGQRILGHLPRGRGCPLCLRSEGCCRPLWMCKAGSSHGQSPRQTARCFLAPLGSRKGHVFPPLPGLLYSGGRAQVSRPNHFGSNQVLKNIRSFLTTRDDSASRNWTAWKRIARFDWPRCQLA